MSNLWFTIYRWHFRNNLVSSTHYNKIAICWMNQFLLIHQIINKFKISNSLCAANIFSSSHLLFHTLECLLLQFLSVASLPIFWGVPGSLSGRVTKPQALLNLALHMLKCYQTRLAQASFLKFNFQFIKCR